MERLTNKSMKQKPKFDEDLYMKVSVSDLIVFAMYSIINDKKKCGFEDLAKQCFSFFPKAFGLKGYPKWPDARKLDRPLRAIRKRKLITGDPKSSFKLTVTGKKRALGVAKAFRQGKLL
jgi:hypothetical protein